MILIKAPRADIGSERWFHPYKRPAKKEGEQAVAATPEQEALYSLAFLVRSGANNQFRSRNAVIRRHIEKMDNAANVGTKDFSLESMPDIDNVDDLLIENLARYILIDWKGVGELVEGKEVPVDYTPEKGVQMLKQNAVLYWSILGEANDIAEGKEQQKEETIAK